MAGKSYVDYRAPLKSWVQNTNFLGLFNPGRYCGFDTLSITGTSTLRIGHIQTGMVVRDYSFNHFGPWGTWVTRQGVVIREFDPLPDDGSLGFIIQSNAGNTYWRYDVLVGEHEYVPVANQQTPAKYFILAGPTSTYGSSGPVLPILTNPARQVILAIIAIPPGTTDLTASPVKLIKMRSADSGAELDAKLTEPNTYSAIQQEKWSPDLITTSENNSGFWNLPSNGNGYKITAAGTPIYSTVNPGGNPQQVLSGYSPVPMYGLKIEDMPIQNGTKITLKVNPLTLLYENYFPDPSGYWHNRGYRRIRFSPNFITGYYAHNGADRRVLRVPRPYDDPNIGNNTQPSGPSGLPGYTSCMVLDLEMINQEWWVKQITYDNSVVHGDRAAYMVADYENTGVISQFYSQPLFTPTNSNNGSAYESYFNFSYNKIVAGVPFGYFLGNQGTIGFRETGEVEIHAHASVRIDYSGLFGSSMATTVYDDTWVGPGTLGMYLIQKRIKPGPGFGVEVAHLLDYKSTRELNPRYMGAFAQNNHFPANFIFTLSGHYILSVSPEYSIFIRFILNEAPTDKVVWELQGTGKGMNCFIAKWLGQGQVYTGGLN